MNIFQGITVGNRTKYKKMTDGSTITVRTAAERKALPYASALNIRVIQSDTGAGYRLYNNGDPTADIDWYTVDQLGVFGGIKPVLLNAVITPTISTGVSVVGLKNFTMLLTSANVALGGTFWIEVLDPTGDWRPIHTQEVTTNDTWPITWIGSFLSIRARLATRNDGTFTASLTAT